MKEPLPVWVLDPQWFVLNAAALLLTIIAPISILGIYMRQARQVGITGLVGCLMSVIGGMLYVGIQFDETFTWPVIAEHAPELLTIPGPLFSSPAFSAVYLLMALLFIPGLVLLSIATARANVLPRWGAVMIAVGGPFIFGGMMVPQVLRAAGAILASSGFIWIGLALYRTKRR